jgi:hypothetical protein
VQGVACGTETSSGSDFWDFLKGLFALAILIVIVGAIFGEDAVHKDEPAAGRSNDLTWPDGKKIVHPEVCLQTRVINAFDGSLNMHRAPGMKSPIVTKIPVTASGISAYIDDQARIGDTWWCPVEWQGLRGYVGAGYLARA